jgi:AraC-like DNA-binding protein
VWFSSALSTLLPSHRHACPELNLIMSGNMAYRVQGCASTLEGHAGQLIVLPAGTDHELIRSSEDVALWVFELNEVAALPWLAQPRVLSLELDWKKAVIAAARRLWLRPSQQETRSLQQHLWGAFSSFQEAPAPSHPAALHPAVVRAKRVCEACVDEELDVARLSRESGLSASRLAHLFAEQVGVTPLQYRNFARVQHFIRTYNGDERNLLQAALEAGFGSYAQFHRVFWQVCGEPPAVHFKWLSDSGEVDARRTLRETVDSLSA